jgi:hypothetical protein
MTELLPSGFDGKVRFVRYLLPCYNSMSVTFKTLVLLLAMLAAHCRECPPDQFFDTQHCEKCKENCKCSQEGGCEECVEGYTMFKG